MKPLTIATYTAATTVPVLFAATTNKHWRIALVLSSWAITAVLAMRWRSAVRRAVAGHLCAVASSLEHY